MEILNIFHINFSGNSYEFGVILKMLIGEISTMERLSENLTRNA